MARVEALIAGWGMDEALRRAEAYRRAGADAILIHSKLSRPDEILEFAREWGNRAPLVIVPTKYYSNPQRRVPQGRYQHRDLGEPPGALGRPPRCRPWRVTSTITRRW